MQISKIFYFVPILHLISGKVTKFLVEKLSTSEVISRKPHGGGGGGGETSPTPAPLGLIDELIGKFFKFKSKNRGRTTNYLGDLCAA